MEGSRKAVQETWSFLYFFVSAYGNNISLLRDSWIFWNLVSSLPFTAAETRPNEQEAV